MTRTLAYFQNFMDPVALEILADAPGITTQRIAFDADADENWAQLAQVHGAQFLPTNETAQEWFPTRELLERCPNMLAVSCSGAGYDMFDVEAATELGIMMVNNSGANSVSVAQHVVGLAMTLSKQIAQTDKAIRANPKISRMDYVGEELTDKVIGIVGLGNIGRLVAGYMKVFGAKAIACDPYITDADFAERGAEKVDFDTLFREADIVSINCPLNDETRDMVDARAFGLMKPSAYLVNTSRGPIVDEAALIDALKTNKIKGAGLDVFDVEPLPADHELRKLDNTVLTGHLGYVMRENYEQMYPDAVECIKGWMDGAPVRVLNAAD